MCWWRRRWWLPGCCRRAGPRMASGKVAARRQRSGSGQFAATLPEVRSEWDHQHCRIGRTHLVLSCRIETSISPLYHLHFDFISTFWRVATARVQERSLEKVLCQCLVAGRCLAGLVSALSTAQGRSCQTVPDHKVRFGHYMFWGMGSYLPHNNKKIFRYTDI